MEEVITLNSRDGIKNYLKKLKSATGRESTTYLLKVEFPQVGISEDMGKIVAMDPSGGPMMRIGDTIEGAGKIKSFDHILGYGFTVTFEKDDMVSNQ